MLRKSNFNWNEDNKKQLKQVVNDFNKKITRLKKSNPSIKYSLPDKVKYSEIKSIVANKQDFNKNVKRLERFLKPNAEKLVTVKETRGNIEITKWQYQEMNKLVKDVNKNRQERWNKLSSMELKVGGQPLNYTRGQVGMGSQLENELRPTTAFSSSMVNYDVKRKYKSLLLQSGSDYYRKRDYILRDNYIKTLKEEYGNDSKDIVRKLKEMPIDDFLDTFYQEDHPFEFIYKTEKYKEYLNVVRRTWGMKPVEDSDTIKYDGIKGKTKK